MMRTWPLIGLLMSSPLLGQSCPSPSGWADPARHLAARTPDLTFALAVGTSNQISLLPARDVRFLVPSERPAPAATTAGIAALDVPRAGTLDIVLSGAVYVDLVRDGKIVKSSGHADLKSCPGLRKSVSFPVSPGRYIVQLGNGRDKTVRMATFLR